MNRANLLLSGISAGATHRGNVREVNEDAYLDRPDRGLWAVADGMGGHAAGDLASRLVVQTLETAPQHPFLGLAVASLRDCLGDANRRLGAEARRRGEAVIGSTLAALMAMGGHCVSLWVGDSRIYRLRNGTLHRLSHDHSQVQALVDQGRLSPDAMEEHPAAHVVTRALGAGELLEVDAQLCEIKNGDRFLLCTDGLTREIPEGDILEFLARIGLNAAPQALIDEACKRGARDNVTAVVVDFLAPEATPGEHV
ncbi:PP2C family protein-serine/threonine phosphatase [Candidatus Thiosymbion oneisti]|uniref:PP2C family protein-serine/threonine phosphatase n=1 Tax=Candidatus Thiosymbion oneisti TaxID=589554 RepID=UPI000B7E9310|nr:protein phosphatase 2C domain-containing protein [Candidatus Thiosymbion oneisti]